LQPELILRMFTIRNESEQVDRGSKQMTVRKLAEALGISIAGTHKCIKRGMPAESIEAAQTWYRTNGRQKAFAPAKAHLLAAESSAITAPNQPQEVIEEMDRRAEESIEQPVKQHTDTDNCREALNEQRQLRKHAAAQVARLHHSGDIEASRRWAQTHQQYLAKQVVYERQLRDLMERDRRTIQIEDAERLFRSVLQDVRTIAAAMPSALAAKVNPQDPVLAQKLLEEWRDKTLFKVIYENREAAPA
jgi:hypothetical protein